MKCSRNVGKSDLSYGKLHYGKFNGVYWEY